MPRAQCDQLSGPDDLRVFVFGIDFDRGGQEVLDAGEAIAVGGVGAHHQPLHVEGGAAKGEAEVEPLAILRRIGLEALQPVADEVDVMR